MRVTLASTLLALALSTAAGCGGGDYTVADAFDEAITLRCAKAFECKASYAAAPGSTQTFEQQFGASEADCEAMARALIGGALPLFEASVSAGRIAYDADDARTCLDAARAETCAQFWGTEPYTEPAACDTTFVGTVADGGACTLDDDCKTAGSSCDGTTKVCTPG